MDLSTFRRMRHWGALTTLLIIFIINCSTWYTGIILLYHTPSNFQYYNLLVFCIWNILIITAYVHSVRGPGYVERGWKPERESDAEHLLFCKKCKSYKPPRTHHCSDCDRCVLKMDHHCPWINNCVGYKNMDSFVRFLFFVIFGCCHAIFTMIKFRHHFTNSEFIIYPPILPLNKVILVLINGAIALTVFTIICCAVLVAFQLYGILRNQTNIESWIVERARTARKYDPTLPPFVYPYDLGYNGNFNQVFSGGSLNGIKWPVIPGCNQFTLTREEKRLKELKKKWGIHYRVTTTYRGGILGVMKLNIFACLWYPWCSGKKLSVMKGDQVLGVSFISFWCYCIRTRGEEEMKGYVPLCCLTEVKKTS